MRMRMRLASAPLIGLAVLLCATVMAQPSKPTTNRSAAEDFTVAPERLVAELYKSVTFEAGQTPDWRKVRGMFIPEAVVVLRTARDKMSVFSVDGFVEDFVRFIEQSQAQRKGFSEKVVRMKPTTFGEIAHVLVLYEAHLAGSEVPPQRGVDSFELLRKDDRWWITSINNDICTPDRPPPRELQE